ncbi:helix-turn-helix transcriptional regulator [Clostridium sp. NSJ-49]|nr:helix-turn-helix transcriptional regulator [Clostridium sp. NSJ-49]
MGMGEFLRNLRTKEGLTMKELGLKVGVTEQAISQYERNKREPNDEILLKILKALNFDVEPYMKKTVEIDPIWNKSMKYIENLIDFCEDKQKINKLDLSYLTVHEVNNFINKNISYIEKLTKKHMNSIKPKDGIIMKIESVEELLIEVNPEPLNDNDISYKDDYSINESLAILHFKSLIEDLNLIEFNKLSKENLLNIIYSKELTNTIKDLLLKEIQNK